MRFFVLFLLTLTLPVLLRAQQEGCRSAEYRRAAIDRDPGLGRAVQQVEEFTHTNLSGARSVVVTGTPGSSAAPSGGNVAGPMITIPVVVHVVYNAGVQNISDAQVASQIAVLNRDYRKLNADTAQIPAYYRVLAADCGIRFALADLDTNGNATTGIVRKHTNANSFTYDDAVKYTSRGGDDAWDRDRYLNLWVCNMANGVLGYSSVPGCAKDVDGVVLHFTAVGTNGTAQAPFNLGRTATHEIGHWLNLIHIWGDRDCGDDDVEDTPQQSKATRGDPSGIIFSCGNTPYGNLYMDYMDFTDDKGMHLFTQGQKERMRTLFATGGVREALLHSTVITKPFTDDTPVATTPVEAVSLSLYPNPAVQSVQVVTKDASAIGALLEVYDQRGQMVMSSRIVSANMQLNVGNLSGGVYFLRIKDGGQHAPAKLIKM